MTSFTRAGAGAVELIRLEEVQATARQNGVTLERNYEFGNVAQSLNIDGFVEGEVTNNRRQFVVTLTVRTGADGSVVGTETWSGRALRNLDLAGTAYTRLSAVVATTRRPAPPAPPEAAEAPPSVATRADTELPPDTERPADSESDATETGRYSVFSVGLVGGTLRRTMSASVVPQRLGFAERREYTSAGLGGGEIGGELEFFPGAIGSQPFPWLGLVGSYRRSIGLSSRGCGPATSTDACPTEVDVTSTQQELYAGLRGRVVVAGEPQHGLELSVDAGFGMFDFTLDPADLAQIDYSSIIPPFSYQYLHFGVGASYDIVREYLTMGVRGGYRMGLSVGEETRRAWGQDTGGPQSFQIGLDVRSEMPYIVKGLYIGLGVSYFGFITKFEGATDCPSGMCTASPNLYEPLTVQGDVTDSYLRLGLTAGYTFR